MESKRVNQCDYLLKTHTVPNHTEVYEICQLLCVLKYGVEEKPYYLGGGSIFFREEICATYNKIET